MKAFRRFSHHLHFASGILLPPMYFPSPRPVNRCFDFSLFFSPKKLFQKQSSYQTETSWQACGVTIMICGLAVIWFAAVNHQLAVDSCDAFTNIHQGCMIGTEAPRYSEVILTDRVKSPCAKGKQRMLSAEPLRINYSMILINGHVFSWKCIGSCCMQNI